MSRLVGGRVEIVYIIIVRFVFVFLILISQFICRLLLCQTEWLQFKTIGEDLRLNIELD